MTLPQKRNPFKPGYGNLPPFLAGRDIVLNRLRQSLIAVKQQVRQATPIALTGPRGCGKTALLAWIQLEAKALKLPVIILDKQAFGNLDSLQRKLYTHTQKRQQFRELLLGGEIKDPILNLVSLNAGDKRTSQTDVQAILFLEQLLSSINMKGFIVLIDEAHDMPSEVSKVFYDAAQQVAQSLPILLVIAGTPDLEMVLNRSHATFSERIQVERIGRLNREEAKQALIKPFGASVTFSDHDLNMVLNEAQNYPYFIQLWGYALWEVLVSTQQDYVGKTEIDAARVEFSQRAWKLYNRRMLELNANNMLVPITEMALRIGEKRQPTSVDFAVTAQRIAGNNSLLEAEEKLMHISFIWQPEMNQWEYGIPSLAAYVSREGISVVLDHLIVYGLLTTLKVVAQCFGPPPDNQTIMLKSELEAALTSELGGNSQAEMAKDLITTLIDLGILGLDLRGENIQFNAPHLVQKVIIEATQKGLLPA